MRSMQGEMDSLAERIRKEISASGSCEVHQADLACLRSEDRSISNEEKCMHVRNFALRYGFAVAINLDSLHAVFLPISK